MAKAKVNAGGGIGMGFVVFIVLIVVALVQGAPIWGTSWGWFIFQAVLIWFGLSVILPLFVVLFVMVLAVFIKVFSN
jgi:hypothetical protein